jgi:hypothetical protein
MIPAKRKESSGMHTLFISLTSLMLVLWTTVALAGPKLDISPDSYLQVGALGQLQATHTDEATDATDFFLRRARIILSGQMMEGVQFFVDTDSPNAGKAGAPDAEVDIQDAFVDLRVPGCSNHWFKAGLILLPFSFESRSGASTLLGNDYNSEVIKLPNTFVWRDYGAEAHGSLPNNKFAYVAGVFDGYDTEGSTKNPGADLRYTAHVAAGLIGAVETGWFYNQNRIGKKLTYLTLGAGLDRQDEASVLETKATGTTAASSRIVDSEAYVLDMQSGYEIDNWGVMLNAAWYTWDNILFKGDTMFAEGGVWLNKTMMTGKCSIQDPDAGATTEDYTVGLHHFLKGHNVRGGVEYRWGDSADQVLASLQFLL